MSKRICTKCYHYDEGFCKRYPPVIVCDCVTPEDSRDGHRSFITKSKYPEVEEYDTCGEFMEKN